MQLEETEIPFSSSTGYHGPSICYREKTSKDSLSFFPRKELEIAPLRIVAISVRHVLPDHFRKLFPDNLGWKCFRLIARSAFYQNPFFIRCIDHFTRFVAVVYPSDVHGAIPMVRLLLRLSPKSSGARLGP
ncbi:hypothetical protein CEXT_658381 [Caerostris extrusa]|uniref:Uncharacterized protein n=1 Tax=Caerostris extrusa TaxID=172846 RepID=A0AAV4QYN0_CAEEX|nr:hypothetical protein CEXT_658381 [Caerostris extrusa]